MKLKTSKKLRCITVLLAFTMLLTILPGHIIATTATRGEGTTSSGYDYSYGMETISERNVTAEHYEESEISSYTEEQILEGEEIPEPYVAAKMVFEIDSEYHLVSDAIEESEFSASGYVVLINGSNLALAYVGLDNMTGTFNFTAELELNINMTAKYEAFGIMPDDSEVSLVDGNMTFGIVAEVFLTFEVELTWYGSMQVISQAMVTPTGSFMIWQNMMQDFIVYEDVNGNQVFDLNLEMLDVTDIMKEEFKGMGLPGIFALQGAFEFEAEMWMDMVQMNSTHGVIEEDHQHETDGDSDVINENYPSEFEPENIDISTTFTVSEDTANSLTTFEWSITYEDMPTNWAVNDSSGVWHEGAVLQDYTYGYQYVIDESDEIATAELSTTFTMSEMPSGPENPVGEDIKDAVNGYGLAVPTYAAFLVVEDVDTSIDDTHTQPVEVFSVTYQNETYAEYDFGQTSKIPYEHTLDGVTSTIDSVGASVNVAVIEGRMHGTSILENEGELDWMLFAEGLAEVLQDTGGESYDFVLALNLLETNYPEWSGGEIVHDPVMRAYFLSSGEEGDGDEEFEMPAALAVGVLAGVIAVLFFVKMRGGKAGTEEW
jgi:hypothetical protein